MHTLILPALGETMQRGTIVRWLKKEGDSYAIGDVLYEIESEKATVDVDAKRPGTLARILALEGADLPVGAPIAISADPGEVASEEEILAALGEGGPGSMTSRMEETSSAAPPADPAAPGTGRLRVMPRARTLAQEMGVDLARVEGTGPNGAITVADVQRLAAVPRGPRVRERRPLHRVPRAMAEVLTRSWQQVPQFVQVVLVDAGNLVARRRAEAGALKQLFGIDLTYTDLILHAVVEASRDVPEVNASFVGDAVVLYEDVNLSVAVATEAGLVAPVIHRAQELSIGARARKLREAAARARSGTLSPADLEGGTMTVSNLGAAVNRSERV